jgi:ABC-type branched-subunit amino acid transport system substrate-binding protein
MIFTPYPEASVHFVNQLMQENVDLPVVAGSAWGTVDSDVMRRFIANKVSPFLMQTSWLPKSKRSRIFSTKFKRVFAKEPTAEAAYGYDLGVIAGTVLKRTKGRVTRQSFFEAFAKNRCFDHLSVGKLCFPQKGGHANRTIYFLKYSSTGFHPFYEVGA